MKAYLFSMLALVLAVGLCAFAAKPRTLRSFLFLGGSMNNPNSWVQTSLNTWCNNGNQFCGVSFDDSQYPLTVTPPVNKPNSTVISYVIDYWNVTIHGTSIIDNTVWPPINTNITVYRKS